jgi:hypothetical protein
MLQWLYYVSSASILFPAIASVYKYKLLDNKMKILAWFFVLGALAEGVDSFLSIKKLNNMWMFNFYSILEGFVLCYVIGSWYHSKRWMRIAMTLFAFYSILWIYSVIVSKGIFEFNSNEKTVKGLIIIFLSGLLLVRLSMDENIRLTTDYRFWILSSILIYFSITLIVFSTATFFLEDHHIAMYYSWTIHSFTNILANILFAIGFIWYYRKVNFSI